jgi:hypothetical protein
VGVIFGLLEKHQTILLANRNAGTYNDIPLGKMRPFNIVISKEILPLSLVGPILGMNQVENRFMHARIVGGIGGRLGFEKFQLEWLDLDRRNTAIG